jgi:hypothetical protein
MKKNNIKIEFTQSEVKHLLSLIEHNERDENYSGNQLQYWKRSECIKYKLYGKPEPKFSNHCINCGCKLPEDYIGSCYGCDA